MFGSDDLTELLVGVLYKAKEHIWPGLFHDPEIDFAEGVISRIDLTGSWVLDRPEDVDAYLRTMEATGWCPYRGRGVMDLGGSTLYYGRAARGKRAPDWQLKLYSKAREVIAHPLPGPAYRVPGLMEEVNRTIRVELTLRKSELKRLGLHKVGQWTPAKVREVWQRYVRKIDFGEATVNLDTVDLGRLGLKSRHATALAAWKAGGDLQSCMSKATFYRLRRELKTATGYDIANRAPKSNLVHLKRSLTAYEIRSRPEWADDLAQILSQSA